MHMKRLCTERRTCLFYEVVQMGKYLSRSHMSYEVMDTRHTIEVNIVKAVHVMLELLLQKPSKSLEANDYLQGLERRS